MNGKATEIPGPRLQVFLRSFLVQASWNFERLQNLGFAFTIYPALVEKYGAGSGKLKESLERHLGFFNTHPYFSGLVAAAISREEGGELDRGRFLGDLKQSLMSTLGSLGDNYFWAVMRPLATLAALLPALFGLQWAPLLLLAIFNIPHLGLRWWGVSRGMQDGSRVIYAIRDLALPRKAKRAAPLLPLLAGLCAGTASVHPEWALLPGRTLISPAAAAALFFSSALLASGRFPARFGLAGIPVMAALGLILQGGSGP